MLKKLALALTIVVLGVGVLWATDGAWRYPVPSLGVLTTGDVIYAQDANTLGNLNAVAIGRTLVSAGASTAPAWSATPRLGYQLRTYGGTTGTCSTNCGTSPSVAGTDSAALITLGSTPADAFVLTFGAAWAAAPICVAQQQTTAANYITKSISTTTTLTMYVAAGPTAADKVKVICLGQQ